MVQLNVNTTSIYNQLFKSANSIPPSNGNPSCALNFNTTNNKNNNNIFPFEEEIEFGDLNSRLYINVVFTFNCIFNSVKQGL